MIEYMGSASFGMQMVTCLKEILLMSKQMGMEYSCIRMAVDMKDIGKMMFKMGKVRKYS